MEIRSFLLPSAAVLSLCVTPGCGPTIGGTWDLTSKTFDGEVLEWPRVNEDEGYTSTFSAVLTIQDLGDTLTGIYIANTLYSYSDGTTYEYDLTYQANIVMTAKKAYTIVVAESGVDELDLSCTLGDTTLTCSNQSEGPGTPDAVTFTRREG